MCPCPVRPAPRPARRAAATVEFALVVPFLAVLLGGVSEIGRALLVRQTLNDAARKACRTGVLPNRANADIATEVNNILSDNSINLTAVVCATNSQGQTVDAYGNSVDTTTTATITIAVNGSSFGSQGNMLDVSGSSKGDQISVTVTVPFSQVSWTPPVFLTGNSLQSETLVMKRQG
jgi:Flp pilus assembly protein TadG